MLHCDSNSPRELVPTRPPIASQQPQNPARWHLLLAGALLALVALAAYQNSFSGPFIYDDTPAIAENPTIRALWPLWNVLSPPSDSGVTVNGRPGVNLTLAINYALGGTSVTGYHVVNLVIHVLAGLTLFGLIRRTLLLPSLRERFGQSALLAAWVVAALWTAHPLQTESVTYVIQRAESLVGLFYLLTLYCFVRSTTSPLPGLWQAASVAACLLGMGSKEVMVSAPLMVLLYDRTLVTGTFAGAARRNPWLYLGLAATWLLLAFLVATAGNRGGTAGFIAGGLAWWAYAFTQCRAIIHYLWLALWPSGLVFDYGTAVDRRFVDIAPQAFVIVALLSATIIGIWRRWRWAVAGAWFFAILAPSSSVLPVSTETMAEHRMYLPLVAVVVLAVFGLVSLIGQKSLSFLLLVVTCLGALTFQRNTDYGSELAIWANTVVRAPQNARGHNNLGELLSRTGRPEAEAIAQYRKALRLQPKYLDAMCNLANSLAKTGEAQEAIATLRAALRVKFNYAPIHNAFGHAFYELGQPAVAAGYFERALTIDPDYADAHNNLGVILAKLGRPAEAIKHYQHALRFKPAFPDACYNYGNALLQLGRTDEAQLKFEETLQLKPDYAQAHNNLGGLLIRLNRLPEAVAHFEAAVRIRPDYADAHNNLGVLLFKAGRGADALQQFEEALRINPDYADARNNLNDVRKTLQPAPAKP